jgi:hypothetical protein
MFQVGFARVEITPPLGNTLDGSGVYKESIGILDPLELNCIAFYDGEKGSFKDGIWSEHISLIGNLFPYAFGLCPDERSKENILQMLTEREISSVSFFGAFLYLEGLVREGKEELIKEVMLCEGAWLRMLSEGATTTFEGWGKDTKWNTSLFHLTLSYGALFLADFPLEKLFKL